MKINSISAGMVSVSIDSAIVKKKEKKKVFCNHAYFKCWHNIDLFCGWDYISVTGRPVESWAHS